MSKLKPKGVKNRAVITPINPHQQRKDDDSHKEKNQREEQRDKRESQ